MWISESKRQACLPVCAKTRSSSVAPCASCKLPELPEALEWCRPGVCASPPKLLRAPPTCLTEAIALRADSLPRPVPREVTWARAC
jgi:hypothetical protein